jgi:hypothetical protein
MTIVILSSELSNIFTAMSSGTLLSDHVKVVLSFRVHKFAELKIKTEVYKSFPLEMADYWPGMTLEEKHEEDDVEVDDDDNNDGGDYDDDYDPSPQTPHTPRKDPVGRLSEDMKEHQLQIIDGVGTKKYPQKSCRMCAAHRRREDTTYICNTCEVPRAKGDCFHEVG